MSASFAITNARLVDPESGHDGPGGILVENGLIAQIGEELDLNSADEVIDAGGKVLAPALIDLRASKEPALTPDGENQSSLAAGAAAGGFGTVVLAPNEHSPLQTAGGFAGMTRALGQHGVRVLSAAAATQDLAGESMAEIGLMAKAGAVYVSNGDNPIADTRVLRRVMSYASQFDLWLSLRAAEPGLSCGAVATESDWSARFGLPSEPTMAERIAIDRAASVAALSGGKLMVDRVSTADGLAAIRDARKRDIEIAATSAIAHLTLNEVDAGGLDSAFRVDPPLRVEADRRALVEAIAAGEVDAIVSDHRPTPFDDKGEPFAMAIAGTLALETLLASLLALVHDEELSLVEALRPLTAGPADLLGLPQGRLTTGAPADLVLIDGDTPWVCHPDDFHSPRGNSAWAGRRFIGRVTQTFVDGQSIYNYNG
ncbi:MAG: amidohydrolase family protein [Maricaulis sp.]|uniref:dihydroorotase n=1 Tax=Maricaulis sp. TaxID=1486257 RepID=UPI001B21BEE3|nr:dihydroorotase [Maricaulis sp.]MBO6847287.1 amidohydrolase family protein [Maricaulis sp.]MBO6876514.1 amidohydrolase family protein [Maricaulis sp.]